MKPRFRYIAVMLLPFVLAYILIDRGLSARWALLGLLLVEAVLLACNHVFVLWPLFKKIFAIAQASNMSQQLAQGGSLVSILTEIESYIRASEERQDRVQLLQKQAELDALQSQINPHFLYNTLDTIRGQALEEGCEVAPDMIGALSTLLLYRISHRDDIVPLRQELRSIDNYMKIQQFRFSNRFTYETVSDESLEILMNMKIPKLTLQPLVENAIFHGIESLLSGGKIKVELYTTQSRLIVDVLDNGVGMDEEQLSALRKKLATASFTPLEKAPGQRGSGMAILNVNARIQLAFGSKYGVEVFSTKGVGSQFQVSLPLLEDA